MDRQIHLLVGDQRQTYLVLLVDWQVQHRKGLLQQLAKQIRKAHQKEAEAMELPIVHLLALKNLARRIYLIQQLV